MILGSCSTTRNDRPDLEVQAANRREQARSGSGSGGIAASWARTGAREPGRCRKCQFARSGGLGQVEVARGSRANSPMPRDPRSTRASANQPGPTITTVRARGDTRHARGVPENWVRPVGSSNPAVRRSEQGAHTTLITIRDHDPHRSTRPPSEIFRDRSSSSPISIGGPSAPSPSCSCRTLPGIL